MSKIFKRYLNTEIFLYGSMGYHWPSFFNCHCCFLPFHTEFLKESAQDKKVHPNLWSQEMKGNLRKHKVIVNGLKFFVVLKLRKKHSKQRK